MAFKKTDTTSEASEEKPGADAGPGHADLSALDGLAAQVDADTTGTAPDGTVIADQPAPINFAMEAAATVDTFAALLTGYCPDAGALWTDAKKAAVSAALAPVMEKYGFTLGALPCELVLIITAGPLLYQSARMVAAQMAREKAESARAKKVEGATDAADKRAAPTPTGDHQPGPEIKRHAQTALYP